MKLLGGDIDATKFDIDHELATEATEAHGASEVAVMNIEVRLERTLRLTFAFWQFFVIYMLCVPFAFGQTSATAGRVEGTVFVLDSQGSSYVPGAKVTLSGAVSLQQETDSQGHYTFAEVAPGAYTITAEFPGLEATESISVEGGRVAEFPMELKTVEVKTSVTVTETEPEVKTAAPTQTISSSTVINAPNKDDRAESVLPLVPGVVRGPDGRINMGRFPRLQKWISGKQSVIDSAEECLLTFHREAPRAFWASLGLNFLCHAVAILEVYVVLKFMGASVSLLGALALEGLTKLINLAGSLNPGNIGTYEGGNVLITKLFGITATSGLTLALCRRARAIFWAAIGAVCLMLMRRASQQNKTDLESNPNLQGRSGVEPTEQEMNPEQQKHSQTAIILANVEQNPTGFSSSLAHVGTLPMVLRACLTVHGTPADRIIVAAPCEQAQLIRSTLRQTGRFPASVKFRELGQEMDLSSLICHEAAASKSVTIVSGDTIYNPQVLHRAIEWDGTEALALLTGRELAGIYVLPQSLALDVFSKCKLRPQTLADVHSCVEAHGSVVVEHVSAELRHKVAVPEDLPEAERKLDTWLVKPTDGFFARNNRKVSIPISRQLIKLPLTPNMVTMLVLGVSFTSGAFFARGGYCSTLLGAFLSVVASVLDGCDGEVARLKLQSTRFGCWLETVCDYLYYLFVFGGMAIGLTRSLGSRVYLAWGALLCFGAVMSFFAVSLTRQRFSAAHPEKFLAVWQKKAESQSSNPLLFLGRHTEFIIRRCFFPYALLFFAIVNWTKVAFVATALGANLVWVIALYSCIALSTRKRSPVAAETGAALSQQATT